MHIVGLHELLGSDRAIIVNICRLLMQLKKNLIIGQSDGDILFPKQIVYGDILFPKQIVSII